VVRSNGVVLNLDRGIGDESCDRSDCGPHRDEQYADYADAQWDLDELLAFFVRDLDPTNVAFMHELFDLVQQAIAFDLYHFDGCGRRRWDRSLIVALGGSDDFRAFEDPDGEGDGSPHELEHGCHGQPDQPERDTNQPPDRVEEYGQDGHGPSDDE
jgi:hypothetical protein